LTRSITPRFKGRAVFFDAVGTLLHPDPPVGLVYAEAARRFGSRLDPAAIPARFGIAFRRQDEVDRRQDWKTNEAREEQRWRAIVAEVLNDIDEQEECFQYLYNHFAQPTGWRCDPQAGRLLAKLTEDGFLLGMASNFDARLRLLVGQFRELAHISKLVISSEVGTRKPSASFFQAVCWAANGPPDKILFVGDDPTNDLFGARDAGLTAWLLDPKGRSHTQAWEKLSSLEELPERLQFFAS
jgi:putative hydrolase of the HAD superfamily